MDTDFLFEHIFRGYQGSQVAQDLAGRVMGLRWAIVAPVTDPQGLGRIQVYLGHQGGNSTSDWLVRLLPWKFLSVPVPRPGDAVLVGFEEGNPNSGGFYLGFAQNFLNPAASPDAWLYKWDSVEIAINQVGISLAIGDVHVLLKYDEFLELGWALSKITIKKDKIEVVSPTITMGTTPDTLTDIASWSSGVIDFKADKVKVQGVEVALVGAIDDNDDIIVDSGQ